MNFLAWLNSIDPKTCWLDIRDREGLVGIEKRVVEIVQESGYLNVEAVYDGLFLNDDPWAEGR